MVKETYKEWLDVIFLIPTIIACVWLWWESLVKKG